MSVIGARVQRVEDDRFLRGDGRYVANIAPDDAVEVVFVRSTLAHGELLEVDFSEAIDMPGVLAVVDNEALGANPMPGPEDGLPRPVLAVDRVRHVGEPIVAIVAETRAAAVDAAEMVVIDYEPLDAVIGPRAAAQQPTLLYDNLANNTLPPMIPAAPVPDFSECEVVIEAEITNSRMYGAPIEARVAAAHWHHDDTLTCWSSTQGAIPARFMLAATSGLAQEDVRVIVPDLGGGFGAKVGPAREECSLGHLSRIVGRPVLWEETRTESMQAMCHGRAQSHTIRLGGTRDGHITHYHLHNIVDAGYTPTGAGFLPMLTSMVAHGCYDIDNVAYTFDSVVTNTSTINAFRGAGRPEAIATIERSVDLFAAEIGMDPVAVRTRNFIPPDAFPFATKTGSTYDSGNFAEGLRLATELAGYDELRREQAALRASGSTTLLGIGVASFIEVTAPAPGPQSEYGSVTLTSDGRFQIDVGSTPMGQGTETTVGMLAADQLGVPLDHITVRTGDTAFLPRGGITAGSRTTQVLGPTVVDAAAKMVDAAREVAATVLEASPGDVVYDVDGHHFHVSGTPSITVEWPAIASASEEPLNTVGDFAQEAPTYPSGTNIAVVEVDTVTGMVDLLRIIAADDAGKIINPMLAEGQIHGGLGAGIAQALYEEIVYDEDGNLLTSNFADYAVVSTTEVPMFETTHYETPSPNNPLGVKGIGESGTIGSTVAIQNAVLDAIRHLGVKHLDMPMTPHKIWAALKES
ncbi:MAG: xanthine dehydrogenase family protein molybdopterin-binding subunit [Acidimicrobiales bacterium]